MKHLIFALLLLASCNAREKVAVTEKEPVKPMKNLPNDYNLVAYPGAASCSDYIVVDRQHNRIDLPENIEAALSCPSIFDIKDNVLTILDGNVVKLYYLDTKKEKTLFNYQEGLDGISGPAWSKDKSRIMFVLISQERKYDFKSNARMVILKLGPDGRVLKDWKADKPVNFSCASICSSTPYDDFDFGPNDIIKFRKNINMNDSEQEFFYFTLNLED